MENFNTSEFKNIFSALLRSKSDPLDAIAPMTGKKSISVGEVGEKTIELGNLFRDMNSKMHDMKTLKEIRAHLLRADFRRK